MAVQNIPDFENESDAALFIEMNAAELRLIFEDQILVNTNAGFRLIDKMAANGASEAQIIDSLLMDFNRKGPVFGGLKEQFRATTESFSNEAADDSFEFTYRQELRKSGIDPGKRLKMWVSVLAPNVTCNSCFSFHGEIRNANDWIGDGPRQRYTECGFNCLCTLQDTETVADDLKADTLGEIRKDTKKEKRDFVAEVKDKTTPVIRSNRASRRTDENNKESKQYNRLSKAVDAERKGMKYFSGTTKDELDELMRKAVL
jgi:hypothetical protein